MKAIRPSSLSPPRWTPSEIAALLQAVEPLGGPEVRSTMSVRDRHVEVDLDPADGPVPHHGLVHAGRLVGAVEHTLRALGWAPRTVIGSGTASRPLVTIAATRRRPATAVDLARRRVDRRPGDATASRYAARPDQSRVVDVAHAAGTRGGWLHLLNGATRDGAPAWRTPGTVPAVSLGLALPWRRDPVLAVCTHVDGPSDGVVAGIVLERTVVEAALRGLGCDVHVEAFDDDAIRAATLTAADLDRGVGHAAVRLHP